jgi:hypothetical protein
MRGLPIAFASLALVASTCVSAPASAQDAPDAGKLVDRSIAFHGGRAALEDWPSVALDGSYEMSGRMAGRSVEISRKVRGDGAYLQEVTFEFRGRKVTMTEIFDHAIRKRRFRVGWDDLPLDEPAEEAAHAHPFLLEVADRDPVLAGDGSEADVPVWYVEVQDGRGTARLGLAKDDARLVSVEFPGVEAEGMGTREDVVKKVLYRDYRPLGDVQYPYDQEYFTDGTPDGRLRIEEAELLAEFDETWLEIPDPTDRFIPSEELVF